VGSHRNVRGSMIRTRASLTMVGLGALGGVCALVVAACGSTSAASGGSTDSTSTAAATIAAASSSPTGTSTTGTPTTGTSTNAAGFAAYRSCLTAHGLTGLSGGRFGRGGAGGAGAAGTTTTGGAPAATETTTTGARPFSRPALSAADQKALAACSSLRPSGGFGFGGGAGAGGGGRGFASSPKFVACLKSHGVSVGANGRPAFTPGSSTNQSAFAACRSLLPAGGFGGGAGGGGFGGGGGAGAAGGGANGATFARYQACLRSHGIQPGAAGGAPSSKLTAAIAACRSVLSSGGSAGSTQTTTG
jgi:hypothetical protein